MILMSNENLISWVWVWVLTSVSNDQQVSWVLDEGGGGWGGCPDWLRDDDERCSTDRSTGNNEATLNIEMYPTVSGCEQHVEL